MLEFRLKALKAFKAMPMPKYGPDLSFMDFDSFTYFHRVAHGETQNWDEVPETIKNTFTKLGIPEAEQKFLSGVTCIECHSITPLHIIFQLRRLPS